MNVNKKNFFANIVVILFFLTLFLPNIHGVNGEGKDHLANPELHTFIFNNTTRQYVLYIPDSLESDAPLLFVLHGYSGNAWSMMNYTGMNSIADENEFAICYPQGALDYFGISHWNARLNISSVDDIGFLSSLAEFLQSEYSLSNANTFSCGHSNGGFMSYTLACEASDVFKAIASVAGTMSGYTWNNRNISEPIPILQIHGLNDTVVPIDGSMSPVGGWGGAPHVDTIIDFWSNLNNYETLETEFISPNTNASFYKNGINGNQVWYYKINNWGHGWPGPLDNTGTNASEVIWDFFNQYLMTLSTNQSHFNRAIPIRHATDGDWAGGQNFTSTVETLTKVEIYMRTLGWPDFDFVIELREDNPTGTLLATQTVPKEEISSSWMWLEFDFEDITVTPDTKYCITVPSAPEGITNSFGYEWAYGFGDVYPDGSFWFNRLYPDDFWWMALPSKYEFTFRTYGY